MPPAATVPDPLVSTNVSLVGGTHVVAPEHLYQIGEMRGFGANAYRNVGLSYPAYKDYRDYVPNLSIVATATGPEGMDLERHQELLDLGAAALGVDPDERRLPHGGAGLLEAGLDGARSVEDERCDRHQETSISGR